MIGIWSTNATIFLLVLAVTTTATFALPILLTPLRWARLVQWRIPEHTDLTVYFGRCLGAFILVIEFLMFQAALSHQSLVVTYRCLLLLWGLMIVIHAVGALQRTQPMTETLEIGFWVALTVLTLLFWPVATSASA
jgi:hypothetical protein